MKAFAISLILLWNACVCRAANESAVALDWRNDYAAAVASAAENKRPLLLNFTGSDWCVWCHRLRDEVFQTQVFANYASESLVLVELDFPRKKTLPTELKKQNDTLAEKFSVTGYPTVILLSPEGTELARLGYMQGGPKTFVRELKRQIAAADSAK